MKAPTSSALTATKVYSLQAHNVLQCTSKSQADTRIQLATCDIHAASCKRWPRTIVTIAASNDGSAKGIVDHHMQQNNATEVLASTPADPSRRAEHSNEPCLHNANTLSAAVTTSPHTMPQTGLPPAPAATWDPSATAAQDLT